MCERPMVVCGLPDKKSKQMIYLDNAATKPLCASARQVILDYLDKFANPSSRYKEARDAYEDILNLRKSILSLFNASPDEYKIYFTSGGTESNNWAIKAMAHEGRQKGRNKIIISSIEHPSVYKMAKSLEGEGFEVCEIKCDDKGIIDYNELSSKVDTNTALVSIMFVNNQIGSVQPIGRIAKLCEMYHVPFHTDAVQAVGQIKIDLSHSGIDLLSASSHKFGGMKGVGFLIAKSNLSLPSFLIGGNQNYGKRAGTENLLGIASTGAALAESLSNIEDKQKHIKELRNTILRNISPDAVFNVNGDLNNTVPQILNLSFYGLTGIAIAQYADDVAGIKISTTSACESFESTTNRVLAACGYLPDRIESAIRISFSPDNTVEECMKLVECINKLVTLPILEEAKDKPYYVNINPDGYYPECGKCGNEIAVKYDEKGNLVLPPYEYCPYCGARLVWKNR